MNLLKVVILLIKLILSCSLLAEPQESYSWTFPKDHGAHHQFNTEWWYFTGHLNTKKQEVFGFELTFFRVDTNKVQNNNEWDIKNIYFAHFTITDETNQKFYFFERINRESFDMAGAKTETLHVWNGDWLVKLLGSQIKLNAKSSNIDLRLELSQFSNIILNGKNGYSIKNHEKTQASYYYSMPRIKGFGQLEINNKKFEIDNASVWFDHEFFNSNITNQQSSPYQQSVGADYIGWDWFAIQLDDGRNLMIAKVRSESKEKDFYFGTLSYPNGDSKYINHNQINLIEQKYWVSSKTNIRYPSRWNIKIETLNIDIFVKPTLNNQELQLSKFKYWEGRASVNGTHRGNAYVELVGYK
ncbi:hypothetical protein DID75_05725 [Candidatus Marinamargulisbacteria bacterium SCGC AG-410-N11]|nr:hypothetical protein DID75_05725 [Candidatus Marinamargulisbacteria bacterium SCGC AG-410-N11]